MFNSIRKTAQIACASVICLFAGGVSAEEVFITPEVPFVEFDNGEEYIFVERNQDPDARIPEFFTKTSRQCPPFCIQPMSGGEGVTTVGELEVLSFMEGPVAERTGLLIDARLRDWFQKGTIPGSINLPFNLFENPDTNPFLVPVLQLMEGSRMQAEIGPLPTRKT